MSSLVSGIGKIFTSIAGGVAKLGSAVRAVGASLFTASAATGTGLTSGLGSIFGGGGGVLSNILGGAIKTGLAGALIGAGVGAATGGDWKKGALVGGLGGAVAGGLGGAMSPVATPTGVDPITTGSNPAVIAANTPTGAAPNLAPIPANMFSTAAGGTGGSGAAWLSATPGAATPGAVKGGGFLGALGPSLGFGEGGFWRTEGGAGALAGLGAAAGDIYAASAVKEAADDDREFLRKKERRITDSYKIDPSALAGNTYTPDTTVRPTPAKKWEYNVSTGMVEMVA